MARNLAYLDAERNMSNLHFDLIMRHLLVSAGYRTVEYMAEDALKHPSYIPSFTPPAYDSIPPVDTRQDLDWLADARKEGVWTLIDYYRLEQHYFTLKVNTAEAAEFDAHYYSPFGHCAHAAWRAERLRSRRRSSTLRSRSRTSSCRAHHQMQKYAMTCLVEHWKASVWTPEVGCSETLIEDFEAYPCVWIHSPTRANAVPGLGLARGPCVALQVPTLPIGRHLHFGRPEVSDRQCADQMTDCAFETPYYS